MRRVLTVVMMLLALIAQAQAITIEHDVGSTYILWKWNCTNPNTTVNVSVDGVAVMTNASCIGEYLLKDVNGNELHMIKVVNATNESDFALDVVRTLPPFSFFLALLLITFSLIVIVFATTSTTRIVASIFSLIFTAFTYKYSLYYASPLSYLLLFAFFFTFALMLMEVLRVLTTTLKRKPRWEEEFWSEWQEGRSGRGGEEIWAEELGLHLRF